MVVMVTMLDEKTNNKPLSGFDRSLHGKRSRHESERISSVVLQVTLLSQECATQCGAAPSTTKTASPQPSLWHMRPDTCRFLLFSSSLSSCVREFHSAAVPGEMTFPPHDTSPEPLYCVCKHLPRAFFSLLNSMLSDMRVLQHIVASGSSFLQQ